MECVEFGGNSYKLVNQTATFHQAQSYCSIDDNDRNLVSIHSPEESNFVGKLLEENDYESFIHIGGFVTTVELCDEDEDKWSWSDGSLWNYTHWYPGYPKCFGINYQYDLFCAQLSITSDFGVRWKNFECSDEYGFLCKWMPN